MAISKNEFYDTILDLVKRKWFLTEPKSEKLIEVKATHMDEVAMEEELSDSHYMRPHWARATTEKMVQIRDVKEPVVALIDHGSKKNLMSMDFYKKGKWSINNKHEWKIRAVTRTMEELHGACPNIRVKVGDVEIDRHFFVQESSSHPVILAEPYITAARTEMKVLHNGSTYARVKS
mgnify:CR=1 FL=1